MEDSSGSHTTICIEERPQQCEHLCVCVCVCVGMCGGGVLCVWGVGALSYRVSNS